MGYHTVAALALILIACQEPRPQAAVPFDRATATRDSLASLPTAADSVDRLRQVWVYFETFPRRRAALIASLGPPDSSSYELHERVDGNGHDTLMTLYFADLRFEVFQSGEDSSNGFTTRLDVFRPRAGIPHVNVGQPCGAARHSLGAPFADSTAAGVRMLSFAIPREENTLAISCVRDIISRVSWLPFWD